MTSTRVERTTKPSCMQDAAHRDRFWIARPSSRCPRGRRSPEPSSLGRRAGRTTPRRTSAARTQKSVVITRNLFSRPHRHSYGPRGAGVSRRAAYACGLSACTGPSRARMKSSQAIRDSVSPPYYRTYSVVSHAPLGARCTMERRVSVYVCVHECPAHFPGVGVSVRGMVISLCVATPRECVRRAEAAAV